MSCVQEDLISLWLLGLVCIALGWPRLRRQSWWLRLDDLAGRCQWEWWRRLRSPAGRAMPCIKLLPLPPPRGRHWPVGGFQQCGVCIEQSWRAVPAMDVDDVRCVHVSVRQACSGCVSGSAANALGGQNLEVCSFLCPWWFL